MTTSLFSRDYKIGSLIGRGSFARVHVCTHIKTGGQFAVKVINLPSSSSERDVSNDGNRKRTQNARKEVIIQTKVAKSNSGVVKVHEVFEETDGLYVVMELMSGGSLVEQLEKELFDENTTREYFKTLIVTIEQLHAAKVVHRDIKLENILLTSDKKAKLSDFGLATLWRTDPLMTLCGSPAYVAPEIINTFQTGNGYTPQCDMWSVGVVLFMMLCGQPPFIGESREKLFENIQKGAYYMDPEDWCDVSEAAKDLVSKLLVVDASQRLTAAQAMEHPFLVPILGVELSSPPAPGLLSPPLSDDNDLDSDDGQVGSYCSRKSSTASVEESPYISRAFPRLRRSPQKVPSPPPITLTLSPDLPPAESRRMSLPMPRLSRRERALTTDSPVCTNAQQQNGVRSVPVMRRKFASVEPSTTRDVGTRRIQRSLSPTTANPARGMMPRRRLLDELEDSVRTQSQRTQANC